MDTTTSETIPLVQAPPVGNNNNNNGKSYNSGSLDKGKNSNAALPSYQNDLLVAPASEIQKDASGSRRDSLSCLRQSVGIGLALMVGLALILLQVRKSQLLHRNHNNHNNNNIPQLEDYDDDFVLHRRRRHPHHPYTLVVERLHQLDKQLEGTIYMRHDIIQNQSAAFESAAKVWNLYATQHPPYAVIQVQHERDVQIALPVLSHLYHTYGVPFRVRSGGHHKAGYSSVEDGIVLSLVRMNTVELDLPIVSDSTISANSSSSMASTLLPPTSVVATFGPAALVKDVIVRALEAHGYAGVIGACGTVAESGFVLGGGFGFQSRHRGLGLDNVVSMRVVLANGTALELGGESNHPNDIDNNNNDDLFWALRGGGGGNFGVVTQLRYQLHKTFDMQVVGQVTLSYQDAASVMYLLGQLSLNPLLLPSQVCVMLDERRGSDELGLNFLWFSIDDARNVKPVMRELKQVIDAIFHQAIPSTNYNLTVQSFSWSKSLSWGNDTEFSSWANPYAQAWCGYLFPDNNTMAVWTDIMNQFSTIMEVSPFLYPDVELYGGAIAQVPWNVTAFPYRQAVYNVGVLLLVPKDDNDPHEQLEVFHRIVAKVDALWRNVSQYLTGTYVNYPMASLAKDEYARRYWGDNLERLVRVKQRYDPQNVFTFEQSVPLHL